MKLLSALLVAVCVKSDLSWASNDATVSCYAGDGSKYTGTKSTTKSGIICQRWDTDYPHRLYTKAKDPNNYPDDSLNDAGNYCRNPYDETEPWC